VDPNN
jgi:hypothetical protein